MNVDAFIKAERKQVSPCCNYRIQVVYKTINSSRTAAVYLCLKCDRLHVIDSRDPEAEEAQIAPASDESPFDTNEERKGQV